MFNLGKFVHSKTGRILMSLLLGLGLASLFRKVCNERNCIIFHAPPLEKLKDKIYKDGAKCYKFNSVATKCDNNKKIVSFEEDNFA
jgi:hypothetical protein